MSVKFDDSVIEESVKVICETYNFNVCRLRKHKFKTPGNLTIGKFQLVLRSYMEPALSADQAIYMFVIDYKSKQKREVIVPISHTMAKVRQEYVDNQGIVHIMVARESTFG